MEPHQELDLLIADIREQVLYLQELGVEALDVRIENLGAMSSPRPIADLKTEILTARAETPRVEIPKLETPKPAEPRPAPGSRLSSLPSLSKRIQPSEPMRSVADVVPEKPIIVETETKTPVAIADAVPASGETIEQIRAEIGHDCTRCKLATLGRSKVVNSTGNFNADLMFVGEAPGADEDEQGFPFVGRAGQLLTKIIESIGIGREDVFIGNINRCRPPGNRAPEPDETIACKPFLKREIAVVRPRVIVVLGATAAQNLLETKVPIGKLRGQFHDYLGTKVMPTFHPAYLLRDPHKKREVWEDMKMVRDFLASA
ncbi:MAG: uracil-DNA glycosylase [Pyrinomonadaceae bacterium]|nr:uracil-DNA glycosylase [Pyrinomonadaceae bacterium]